MDNSKRTFLKVAGISALGLGAGPIWKAFASAGSSGDHTGTQQAFVKKNDKALHAEHWAMVIDTRKFEENPALIDQVQQACHNAHNVPNFLDTEREDYDPSMDYRHEIKWIWGEEYKHAFPNAENEHMAHNVAERIFPVLCNHCENPPCVRVCPTKATFKRDDGIVLMDFHRCIGCRFCMAACPYGSRSFNYRDPRTAFMKDGKLEYPNPAFPTRMKGVVEKCNFCAERLAVGQLPACVEASAEEGADESERAIVVGDLEDPESEVRALLAENYTIRRKPNLGTGPSVFYIV